MNLLLFAEQDRVASDRICIRDHRLEHLHTVLNAQEGDSLRVGELNGLIGHGRLLSLSASEALLEVSLTEPPPAKLPLILVLALPRPKMLRRIVRTIAELGVAELHLINSYRVEKSYWQTPALASEVVTDYFVEGLAQARDTVLPTLHVHRRFKPFVEDTLPGLLENRRGLIAHPGDHPSCPRGLSSATTLVIGPEGGFIPYEVEKAQGAGCESVSLGPRILRVENAVSALIARLF